MRRFSRTLLAVFLFALGLAACGGGDSSSSTAAEAGAQGQSESKSSGAASKQADAKGGGGESESGGAAGGEGQSGSSGGESASSFVPKHHSDSGGGSKQFRTKGGDNSVQEFGGEADTSERDAAAAALHNFLDARAAGDWAVACSYLAKSVTESLEELGAQSKQVEDASCSGILEKLTNPAAQQEMNEEAAKADVGSLRVEGERAFLIYTDPDGTVLAMPMANEGGNWKVAALAGTPLS